MKHEMQGQPTHSPVQRDSLDCHHCLAGNVPLWTGLAAQEDFRRDETFEIKVREWLGSY